MICILRCRGIYNNNKAVQLKKQNAENIKHVAKNKEYQKTEINQAQIKNLYNNKLYTYFMEYFHIFIASCYEGLDTQVPRLINNILEVNIPVNFVHFIIGGCPEDKVYYDNGIEMVNVKYRCFEFTPHIYIVNNPDKYDFDFAFFTHDTVKFGKNFYNIILNQ